MNKMRSNNTGAKTIYEVVAPVGIYTDKSGQEKNRYRRIGAIIETSKGPMLKLDSIPLSDTGWNGWAFLNTPKPKEDPGFPPDDEF